MSTHAGELEVTLRALHDGRARVAAPIPENLIAALAALETDDHALDDDRRVELEDELILRFADFREAKGLRDIRWPQTLMDMAADTTGLTIASFSREAFPGAPERKKQGEGS